MTQTHNETRDHCYAGRGGWQTCTECNGRIHDADCTTPKRAGVDCQGCMPPDAPRDSAPTVAECKPTCEPGAFGGWYHAPGCPKRDVRPVEVRR